jgi:hypothetical protein
MEEHRGLPGRAWSESQDAILEAVLCHSDPPMETREAKTIGDRVRRGDAHGAPDGYGRASTRSFSSRSLTVDADRRT